MQTIYISDPEWQETFPHRVAPLPDEWLPGLLLRCDEVNDWDSGKTLMHLRRSTKWKYEMYDPKLIVPSSLKFDHLAQWLAVPQVDLLATTYLLELARCYRTSNLFTRHLTAPFELCLCPACLAQKRLLRRIFALPGITCCPVHHLELVNACRCGTQLQLFTKGKQPFTCHTCSLDWSSLPLLAAKPESLALDQHLLTYYEFFFSKGEPELFERALWLVNDKMKEERLKRDGKFHDKRQTRTLGKIPPFPTNKNTYYGRRESSLHPYFHKGTLPLGTLVELLVEYKLPLDQILVDTGPLPYSSDEGD
jgi:TniQ